MVVLHRQRLRHRGLPLRLRAHLLPRRAATGRGGEHVGVARERSGARALRHHRGHLGTLPRARTHPTRRGRHGRCRYHAPARVGRRLGSRATRRRTHPRARARGRHGHRSRAHVDAPARPARRERSELEDRRPHAGQPLLQPHPPADHGHHRGGRSSASRLGDDVDGPGILHRRHAARGTRLGLVQRASGRWARPDVLPPATRGNARLVRGNARRAGRQRASARHHGHTGTTGPHVVEPAHGCDLSDRVARGASGRARGARGAGSPAPTGSRCRADRGLRVLGGISQYTGTWDGAAIEGEGYVELTGYAPAPGSTR